jgi:hypothetical protein
MQDDGFNPRQAIAIEKYKNRIWWWFKGPTTGEEEGIDATLFLKVKKQKPQNLNQGSNHSQPTITTIKRKRVVGNVLHVALMSICHSSPNVLFLVDDAN